MLTLRSSHFLRFKQPHRLSIISSFRSLLKPHISFSLNPNLNPNLSMSSSGRSVFDVLMTGARAASKKKPPIPKKSTSSPSPRKQEPSLSENPNSTSPVSQNPKETSDSTSPLKRPRDTSSDSIPSSVGDALEGGAQQDLPIAKKSKATIDAERIADLKSKIELLKKKAGNFDPKMVAVWGKGERVPFLFLCLAFDLISNESSRIIITDIVCNMLRTVIATTPEDLVPAVYLAANKIAPAHAGLELGIGDTSIIKAMCAAFGRTEARMKEQYKTLGDLGLVAKESRSSQSMMSKPNALTLAKVFATFQQIAKEAGKDSQEKKKKHIKALLVAATDCEPQYLIRLLQTKLRIGLAEQTLLAALGQASVYNEEHSKPPSNIQSPLEEAAKIVKHAFSVLPVYDNIVNALLSGGVWNLPKTCDFTLGIPVGPMLAKATKGVTEIVNKFQNMIFTCEYKYDGERAQIHYMEDGSVEIYSRNAERNTGKFPDVILTISRLKKPSITSFVLDCEIVAYDRKKDKILPFQTLSTRARKNVSVEDIKVDVSIYAFDMLYYNGQPLLQENLEVRREKLYAAFEEEAGYFQFATAITSNDIDEIQKFLDASVDSSCEGLIIKTLKSDATYEPSKRSLNWLKLKKDYMDSIGDSVDLVPIGAFHGRGKRTGVYGAFLLACYDSNNEEFQSICKIGTGFSEAVLEERSTGLRSKVIPTPKPYYRFSDAIKPDVWFDSSEVWEVKAADLTISPVHRAAMGIVDRDKGISLRFPRLLRVREDKRPEEATSSEQIADMYNAQKHNHPNNQDNSDED